MLAAFAFALTSCGGDPAKPDVPPALTLTTTGVSTSIVSGATVQLTARVTDKRGSAVQNPVLLWSSSDGNVATVSPAGLVRGAVAGSAIIQATATTEGASGSITVTVVPGAAAKLVVSVQPAGVASGTVMSTQPVVEVRDAADNVVTTATPVVTAALASGGGTLNGTVSVTAVQGIARFTDLSLSGTIGPKALQFSSSVLALVQSASFTLQAGAPVAVQVVVNPLTLRSGLASATPLTVALTDLSFNVVPLAGRRIVTRVSSGVGVTLISGTTAITDAQGRASFPNLIVTGAASTRSLTVTADSTASPGSASIALVGGRPRSLAFERDAPESAELGVAIIPPPIVRLIDSVGNTAPEARVAIRASLAGATNSVTGDSVVTDSLGRATFASLTIQGSTGLRALQFSSAGLTTIASRNVAIVPADTSTPPTFITTSTTASDTTQRIIVLNTPTAVFTPYLSARNAQNQPMGTAGVRWVSRDPSRATVATDGRITGVRGGRTFVVAQASKNSAVADSVLVFVPTTATGPIVRATLPSYRIATDTFSIIVQVESRDERPFAAADLEIAWPGSASSPYSPFIVTSVLALRAGVVIGSIDRQDNARVTWASTTPVSGAVQLVRLVCRVNQRNVGNQMVITLNQLLTSDLTDIASLASIFQPVVIVP